MSSDSGEKKQTITKKHNQEPQLPCPRCDSTNTKFCYYNNYNFSQPRHYCKSCRRYWTHGGTLRDIPVGGSTRKNTKRTRLNNTTLSSAHTNNNMLVPFAGNGGSGGSFTSLLCATQNYHHYQQQQQQLNHGFFGFDQDLGFGVGRTCWPFNGGGGITWQMESGGDGGGECFVLPELGVSTSGDDMKSSSIN